MVQLPADFLFALEAFGEDLIAFDLRVRKLDDDLAARLDIGGAVYRGYVTAGDDAINAVVIELVAGINLKSSFAGLPHPYFTSEAILPACKASWLVVRGVITRKLD